MDLKLRLPTQFVVISFIVLATAGGAYAGDSVSLRYLPGYPLPDQSIERVEVRVERVYTSPKAEGQDIDRFFSSVQAILSEHGIVGDWQAVIPDAPSIEITVLLNGRRIRLASAHVVLERKGNRIVTERGMESLDQRTKDAVLSKQSEPYRRHRIAFEKLLSLTLERVQSQLSP